jgi:hypothetical protein
MMKILRRKRNLLKTIRPLHHGIIRTEECLKAKNLQLLKMLPIDRRISLKEVKRKKMKDYFLGKKKR